MKYQHKRTVAIIGATVAGCGVFLVAQAQPKAPAPRQPPMQQQQGLQAAQDDMRATLGVVPSFLAAGYADEGIPGFWREVKQLELATDTALPPKIKNLISLAVSAQGPCEACTYHDHAAARANGATEREVKEAVAMASITRHWSTVLNGSAPSMEAFRTEVAQIMDYLRKGSSRPGALDAITDAPSAYRDAQATLGLVPSYLMAFPKVAVAPAWKQLRAVQLNPQTALSGKYKELVGLAVAAQIPCSYCVHFHTEAARFHGATSDELAEAIGMAALSRQWSTIVAGSRVDKTTLMRETDQMLQHMRRPLPTR